MYFLSRGLSPNRVSQKIASTHSPQTLGMVSLKEAVGTSEGEHPRCSGALAGSSNLHREGGNIGRLVRGTECLTQPCSHSIQASQS